MKPKTNLKPRVRTFHCYDSIELTDLEFVCENYKIPDHTLTLSSTQNTQSSHYLKESTINKSDLKF